MSDATTIESKHTPEPWPEPEWDKYNGHWIIPHDGSSLAEFEKESDAIRARALWNATLDMADPAKEIQAMGDLIEKISKRKCEILAEHGQTCRDYPNDAPDDYCPSCLARHTLGGKA